MAKRYGDSARFGLLVVVLEDFELAQNAHSAHSQQQHEAISLASDTLNLSNEIWYLQDAI